MRAWKGTCVAPIARVAFAMPPGVDGAVTGLLYGDGGQFAAQLIASVVVAAWAFSTMYVFFKVQDKLQGIRSSEADELAGLDVTEMGVLAYPDFAGSGPMGGGILTEVPSGSDA